MRLAGPPTRTGAGWTILLVALAGLLFVPSADAQACGGDPTPPHCMAPDLSLELPDEVQASYQALADGEADELSVPVNVTYETDADDETEVTVEPGSETFQAEGGSATVSTGETVQVPVDLVIGPDARAGAHEIPLFVNTSATDVHEPTSQGVEATVRVPWLLGSNWRTSVPRLDVVGDGDVEMRVRVEGLRVNGPVDFLVTNETMSVEPGLYEATADWEPGRPLVQEWNVTFHGGAEQAFEWDLWPVVPTDGSHSCIVEDTGELAPIEGGDPPRTCQRAGAGSVDVTTGSGALGTIVLVAMSLVLAGMVGAGVLGVFVLRRGGSDASPRALGTYLLLAASAFGLLALHEVIGHLLGWALADTVVPEWTTIGIFAAMALLPAAILTFAVSYPTLHPRLRGSRWWPAIPIGPSIALAGYVVLSFLLDPGTNVFPLRRGVPLTGSLVLAGAAASVLFRRRAERASTDLERRRLSFMLWWVALPLAIAATLMLAVYVLDALVNLPEWFGALFFLLFGLVALFPVAGMAWGLLKYKVVDLETKLRFTVSRGFVVSVFVAIFFVASEAAETFFTDAVGPYAGLLAAGLLVLALAPLERLGSNVASTLVDEPVDEGEYERYRKLEVYRATYEEASADEELTDRERSTLDSMADNLGLSQGEQKFVEAQVAQERAGGERGETGAVPA